MTCISDTVDRETAVTSPPCTAYLLSLAFEFTAEPACLRRRLSGGGQAHAAVQDLTVVLTTSSIFGSLFEAIKQPVLNGYILAGSLVGPDGLALVKELVQVESLAQVPSRPLAAACAAGCAPAAPVPPAPPVPLPVPSFGCICKMTASNSQIGCIAPLLVVCQG